MDHPASLDTVVTLDAVTTFLLSAPIFDGLDPAERADVVRIMEIERLTEGEYVFREGEPGDSWFIVFAGRGRVLKQIEGGTWDIRALEPGDGFGEMAVLDGELRSATVRAEGPLTVLRFRRSRFEQLLDQGSLGAYKLVLGLARMLSRRHRELTHQMSDLMSSRSAATQLARYQVSE